MFEFALFMLVILAPIAAWQAYLAIFRPEAWKEEKEKRKAAVGIAAALLSKFLGK